MKHEIKSDYSAKMLAHALHHALGWGDKCAEHDEENWTVEEEGALNILAAFRAACSNTADRERDKVKA